MTGESIHSISHNYQCPNCSGVLDSIEDGYVLECRHCGSRFEAATFAKGEKPQVVAPARAANAQTQSNVPYFNQVDGYLARFEQPNDPEETVELVCSSCGASYLIRKDQATAECVHCGNHMVSDHAQKAERTPDLIVPFAKTAADAYASVRKNYKSLGLSKKEFAGLSEQDFKPVFAPFWLYSGTAKLKIISDTALRSGDLDSLKSFYVDSSECEISFTRVPVDASSKMPDSLMDFVDEFSVSRAVPFSSSYLIGYPTEMADQAADFCEPRATERISRSVFGYTGGNLCKCGLLGGSIDYSRVELLVAPMWVASYSVCGARHLVAVNGQTGRVASTYWSTQVLVHASLDVQDSENGENRYLGHKKTGRECFANRELAEKRIWEMRVRITLEDKTLGNRSIAARSVMDRSHAGPQNERQVIAYAGGVAIAIGITAAILIFYWAVITGAGALLGSVSSLINDFALGDALCLIALAALLAVFICGVVKNSIIPRWLSRKKLSREGSVDEFVRTCHPFKLAMICVDHGRGYGGLKAKRQDRQDMAAGILGVLMVHEGVFTAQKHQYSDGLIIDGHPDAMSGQVIGWFPEETYGAFPSPDAVSGFTNEAFTGVAVRAASGHAQYADEAAEKKSTEELTAEGVIKGAKMPLGFGCFGALVLIAVPLLCHWFVLEGHTVFGYVSPISAVTVACDAILLIVFCFYRLFCNGASHLTPFGAQVRETLLKNQSAYERDHNDGFLTENQVIAFEALDIASKYKAGALPQGDSPYDTLMAIVLSCVYSAQTKEND